MSFAQGQLIRASDWNATLVGSTTDTTPNRVNTIWGPGAGSAGYGQTPLPQVNIGGKITAGLTSGTQWAALINYCKNI